MAATSKRIWLSEDYARTKSGVSVDTDKGVICGLKLCGLESSNGRKYPLATLETAKPLYEGVACYLNHPAKGDDSRVVQDHVGRFVNVRIEKDGLYGDLEYLKESQHAAQLVETATRMPEQIGCSHNAEGDTEIRDGVAFVTKLHEVRSVDIVADPATTNGLFEGKKRTMWTFKKLLESARKAFSGAQKAAINKLLEDDTMTDPLAAGVDEPAGNPEDALSDGFKAGMYAVIDSFCSGDMDLASTLGKLKELAKAHDNLVDNGSGDEPTPEEDDPAMDDKNNKDDKSTVESRLAKFERRDECRDLCESLEFIPTKDQLADLVEIEDPKRRKRIAESFKVLAESKVEKPVDKKTGPKSKGATGLKESRDTISNDDYLARITA